MFLFESILKALFSYLQLSKILSIVSMLENKRHKKKELLERSSLKLEEIKVQQTSLIFSTAI